MAEPSGDRGWSFLSTEAQTMIYEGDAQAYWDDLEQVGLVAGHVGTGERACR